MSWSTSSAQVTASAFSSQLRDDTEVINISYSGGGSDSAVPVIIFDEQTNREYGESIDAMNTVTVLVQKSELSATPKTNDTYTCNGSGFLVENVLEDINTYTLEARMTRKQKHNKDLIT